MMHVSYDAQRIHIMEYTYYFSLYFNLELIDYILNY